jgi:hypothetical protein
MDTAHELRRVFVDLVNREYQRIETEDAEKKEELRRRVEEGIMQLAASRREGLYFMYRNYQEELKEESSSRLQNVLVMHRRFSQAIMTLFCLKRLQRRLERYHLTEWLELPDDLYEWEQSATKRCFELLEEELIQRTKRLTGQEVSEILNLSFFFRVPLPPRLEGFVGLFREGRDACPIVH